MLAFRVGDPDDFELSRTGDSSLLGAWLCRLDAPRDAASLPRIGETDCPPDDGSRLGATDAFDAGSPRLGAADALDVDAGSPRLGAADARDGAFDVIG